MKLVTLSIFSLISTLSLANGAIRIDDFGCGMLNGNRQFVYTRDSRVVMTPPQAGVTVLKCFTNTAPNSQGKAVQFNNANTGLSCNTQRGVTTDWSETVSASGQAVLTCKVHH